MRNVWLPRCGWVLRAALSASLVFAASQAARGADTDVPTAWSNFEFKPYTYQGQIIADHESSADPSHGPAAVQPKAVWSASSLQSLSFSNCSRYSLGTSKCCC